MGLYHSEKACPAVGKSGFITKAGDVFFNRNSDKCVEKGHLDDDTFDFKKY